jgi:hypothetical protein
MRIALVDIDSKMPNLALMKLSAWHKSKGDETFLIKNNGDLTRFDKVYVSCIFSHNRWIAEGIKLLNSNVEIGGGGYDLSKTLDGEIEHIMPDYSLYKCRFSMGFTSRGCDRNCPWCIVPKKEGKIKDHASIKEFLAPYHNKLIILDNNFLQSPKCIENLEFIIKWKLRVNFNQGLDIRLIDDEVAELLSKVRFFNHNFTARQLHFAWDIPQIEDQVIKGIEILGKHGIKPKQLMFYMLCGFNTSFEEDYHRFEVLSKMGVDPYVMLYNKHSIKHPLKLRRFQRWVNRRLYKVCAFKDYKG